MMMAASKHDINKIYSKWEDDLYEKYLSLFPEDHCYTIFDGVVNPSLYADAALKVLIINREAYDQESESYSLNHDLNEKINTGKPIFTNSQTFKYNLYRWLKVIHLIEREDFDNLNVDDIKPLIDSFNEFELNEMILSCGYINIKKSNGKPRSNVPDLQNNLIAGLDIFKEQLRYLSPSIILGGNVGDAMDINEFEWSEKPLFKHSNAESLWELKVGDRMIPFIDNYHPSAIHYRGGDSGNIALDLFEIIHSQGKSYWLQQMNQRCFDL